MGLIDDEIRELREMNKQLIEGDITSKECMNRLKIYKATAEREKMILDVFRVTTLRLIAGKAGLIGDGENFLLPEPDTSKKKESKPTVAPKPQKDNGDGDHLGVGPRRDINSIPGPTKLEKELWGES